MHPLIIPSIVQPPLVILSCVFISLKENGEFYEGMHSSHEYGNKIMEELSLT